MVIQNDQINELETVLLILFLLFHLVAQLVLKNLWVSPTLTFKNLWNIPMFCKYGNPLWLRKQNSLDSLGQTGNVKQGTKRKRTQNILLWDIVVWRSRFSTYYLWITFFLSLCFWRTMMLNHHIESLWHVLLSLEISFSQKDVTACHLSFSLFTFLLSVFTFAVFCFAAAFLFSF